MITNAILRGLWLILYFVLDFVAKRRCPANCRLVYMEHKQQAPPPVMDAAAVSPKGKKRRRFWRLRRQRETERDNNNDDTPSASDGRISPQDEEDVAELLANPWLVSGQWDRLSSAVEEEEEEISKVRVLH